MWFATMMTGPVAGMFSIPRQVRLVMTIMGGLTRLTANRRQKPSLRRATRPPHGRVVIARSPSPLAIMPGQPWSAHVWGRVEGVSRQGPPAPGPHGRVSRVTRLPRAKTRLRGAVPAAARQRLVLALACDTAAAALTCPVVGRVVVVTSD